MRTSLALFCYSPAFPICWSVLLIAAAVLPLQARFDSPVVPAVVGFNSWPADTGDFNSDGSCDFLCAGRTSRTHLWWQARGDSMRRPIGTLEDSDVYAARTADFDNDGDLDVVAGGFSGMLSLALNDGLGGFGAFVQIASVGTADLIPADLNGDGLLDLMVMGSEGEALRWVRQTSVNTWTLMPELDASRPASAMAVADADGDGDKDVFSIRVIDEKLVLLRNNGMGSFSLGVELAQVGSIGAGGLVAVDFEGDGDVDVAWTDSAQGKLRGGPFRDGSLYLGEAPANGLPSGLILQGGMAGASAVTMADVDGDGWRDFVITAGAGGQDVWWVRQLPSQPGNSTYLFSPVTLPGEYAAPLRAGTQGTLLGHGRILALPVLGATPDLLLSGPNGVAVASSRFSRTTGSAPAFGARESLSNLAFRAEPDAVADFDRDGDPDILFHTTSGAARQLAWLRNSNGTFTTELVFSLPNVEAVVADAGDFDGDGDPDVVAAFKENGTMRLQFFRNNGTGFLTPQDLLSIPNGDARDVHAGDSNGDGITDVAVAFYDPSNDNISPLPDINFRDRARLWTGQAGTGLTAGSGSEIRNFPQCARVCMGDFDGDGDVDYLLGKPDDLLSPGGEQPVRAQFFLRTNLGIVPGQTLTSTGDLMAANVDGRPGHEAFIQTKGSFVLGLAFRSDGGGLPVEGAFSISASGNLRGIAKKCVRLPDWNADGRPDLMGIGIQLISPTEGTIGDTIYLNDGRGSHSVLSVNNFNGQGLSENSLATLVQSVCVPSDFDGDGDEDAVIMQARRDVEQTDLFMLRNRSMARSQAWQASDGLSAADGVPANPAVLVPADINGDGVADSIVAGPGSNAIAWVPSRPDAGPGGVPLNVTTALAGVRSVAAADFDSDGDPDIAACSAAGGLVAWYANNNNGASWTVRQVSATLSNPGLVTACDVNRDGRPDLIVAQTNAGGELRWFENAAAGTAWTERVLLAAGGSAFFRALATGDIDRDGDLDLAASLDHPSTADIVLGALNPGNNNPWSALALTSWTVADAADPGRVALADVLGTGILQLMVAAQGTIQLHTGNGNGTFDGTHFTIPATVLSGRVTDFVLDDMDGDGLQDAVVSTSQTSGASTTGYAYALRNRQTAGAWPVSPIVSGPFSPSRPRPGFSAVMVRDADRDGDADVLLAQESSSVLRPYDNVGGAAVLTPTAAAEGPVLIPPGGTAPVLSFVLQHPDLTGQVPLSFGGVFVEVERGIGIPMNTPEAAAGFVSLSLAADTNNDGIYQSGGDLLLGSAAASSLRDGSLTVAVAGGNEIAARVAPGSSRRFFLLVQRPAGPARPVRFNLRNAPWPAFTVKGADPVIAFDAPPGGAHPGRLAVELAGAVLTPLQQWRLTHFGSILNAGPGADHSDPDYDPSANLIEYAMGSLPLDGSNFRRAEPLDPLNNRARLTVLFGLPRPTDVEVIVEAGNGLDAWTPLMTSTGGGFWTGAGTVSNQALIGAIRTTITDSIPLSSQRFLRLRVNSLEP